MHKIAKLYSLALLAFVPGALGSCEGSQNDLPNAPENIQVVRLTKSNTKIDCDGGYFRGISTPLELQVFGAVSNVQISNCKLNGSFRTVGMARTGEGEELRKSSRSPGHVDRARAAAPTRITLDNVEIHSKGVTPVYLGPGTTHFTLSNSTLKGSSRISAIYLDAESAYNSVLNNHVNVKTPREQLAIDASSFNRVYKNTFIQPTHGGIFLYRNCGEGGTIRWSTPSNNTITFNGFNSRRALNWLIRENSRGGNRDYCGDDAGWPWGSSADNNDNGKNNTIRANTTGPIEKVSQAR